MILNVVTDRLFPNHLNI